MVLKHYCCISVQHDVCQFTMVLVRYICLKNLLSIVNMLNCVLPSALPLVVFQIIHHMTQVGFFVSSSFAV